MVLYFKLSLKLKQAHIKFAAVFLPFWAVEEGRLSYTFLPWFASFIAIALKLCIYLNVLFMCVYSLVFLEMGAYTAII